MSLWNKTGKYPQNLKDASTGIESKRNVVVTKLGYVRNIKYTDVNGNARNKTDVLVAIGNLANSSNWGFPQVTSAWSSNTTMTHGGTANILCSFSEPLSTSGLHGRLKMTISNTASGNTMLASSNGTVIGSNQLLFRFKPTVGGIYFVNAHLMANGSATAANVRSLNSGTELANLYFTAAVSNNLGSFTIYGTPSIKSVQHSSNAISAGSTVNTWITFNQNVTSAGSGSWKITIANVTSGNNMTAYSDNTTYITGTRFGRLLFRWKPTVAGHYQLQAQSLANNATKTLVHSVTGEASLKVIGGTTSNTAAPSKMLIVT